MKIKTKELSYAQVLALPRPEHKLPQKPSPVLRRLVRLLSSGDLKATDFTYTMHGMEKLSPGEPALILMNHSSFIDLEMMFEMFRDRPFGIVCTSDGFVGKESLMRMLGCIPTQKFVSDVTLIRDMEYMLRELKTSVLMYPEASYSFDGTATPLPRKMGILLKKLGVPVVCVITSGAFGRDPLYNMLQKRKVKVSAKVEYLLSPEEIKEKTVAQLDEILDNRFSFDNFAWQKENGIVIDEPFRADGLNRILFRCPHCGAEGNTLGKGTSLICRSCGAAYELAADGSLQCKTGQAAFTHIPDWYRWQRQQVRRELEDGTYRLETPVKIGMMVDFRAIYMVGSGKLIHDDSGFHLTGCGGKLDYAQGPLACYSVYADYYWYELGDIICIGNQDALYYCFPEKPDVAARTRMAVEELYKLKKAEKKRPRAAVQ